MDTVPYSNLALARFEIAQDGDTAQDDSAPDTDRHDQFIIRALLEVARRIDTEKGITFAPYKRTLTLDADGTDVEQASQTLHLPVPFMQVDSVTIGGQTVDPSGYVTLPYGGPIITAIRLLSTSGARWNTAPDWVSGIVITGIEGYNTQSLSEAFLDSLDSVQGGGIDADDTVITVSNITGEDEAFNVPRLSAGMLIRIDSEYMLIQRTNISSGESPVHTLKVRRHARGTSAATHANGAKIYVWQPDDRVARASVRWASYVYKRRGAFSNVDRNDITGAVITTYPPDLPDDARGFLSSIVWNPIG